MSKIPHRLYLTEEQIPRQWYNIRADMKEQPDPLINPATMKPAAEEDLYPVFCEKLITLLRQFSGADFFDDDITLIIIDKQKQASEDSGNTN